MWHIPDNTDVARAYYIESLAKQGLDSFEIALKVTALENQERIKTLEEVFEMEMTEDLKSNFDTFRNPLKDNQFRYKQLRYIKIQH